MAAERFTSASAPHTGGSGLTCCAVGKVKHCASKTRRSVSIDSRKSWQSVPVGSLNRPIGNRGSQSRHHPIPGGYQATRSEPKVVKIGSKCVASPNDQTWGFPERMGSTRKRSQLGHPGPKGLFGSSWADRAAGG